MTCQQRALVVALCLVLSGNATAHSQSRSDGFALSVMLMDQPQPGREARVWLVIKNTMSTPYVLCRPYWSYTLIPLDPGSPGLSEAKASLHGCGDDDHDGFWLLLPGESRFDSFDMKAPSAGDHDFEVEVELVGRPAGSNAAAVKKTLSWTGRLSEAVAAGKKLIAGSRG